MDILAAMKLSGSDRARVAGIAVVMSWLTAAVGIFWLPWYFGATTPVNGESYVLGFNNKMAVLALAAALGLGFLGRLLGPQEKSALQWLRPRVRLPSVRSEPYECAVFATWLVVWSAVLWSWGTYLADPGWADARIFHHGMSLVALGQVPYRDFMWNYGLSMLYLPYWVSWFTDGDVSFERAYLGVLLLLNALGYFGLFLLVRVLVLQPRHRPLVLAVCLMAWAVPNIALQGTSLRYLVVPTGLILMHQAVQRQRSSRRRRIAGLISGAVSMTSALAISPDVAIAALAGILGYLAVMVGRRAFGDAAAICVGGSAPALLMMVFVPDYVLSVKAFASGQYNFPIYLNVNNVALVAASLVVIPSLMAAAFMKPLDGRAPLAMGLAVGAGMLLPGAFGRADPIHVSFNGVVPVVMMFATAAVVGVTWLRWWTACYALIFVVAVQVSFWSIFSSYFRDAIAMRQFYDANPAVVAEWKADWDRLRAKHPLGHRLHWESVLPFPKELDGLVEKGLVLQTAGDEWNLWLGRYLLLQPNAPRDYFHPWTQGAVTPPQLDRRVETLRQARHLLIPESVLAPLSGPIDLASYGRQLEKFFSGMLLFPVSCTPKHEPFQPESEIAKRLLEDYKPVSRFQFFMYPPFIICERKTLP